MSATIQSLFKFITENRVPLEFLLSALALLGAGVGFWVGLKQWRRGQEWQRAGQLDQFVQQFENDERLRLAATVIDWTRRTTMFKDRAFTVTNTDALLALRIHKQVEIPKFEREQPILRDAYDALLAFFARLELALTTRLIDVTPARQYFGYWLDHFLRFDIHEPEPRDEAELIAWLLRTQPAGKEVNPEAMAQEARMIREFIAKADPPRLVAAYIKEYGDEESIQRLCDHFMIGRKESPYASDRASHET